jgi:RNA polymerase sigma-70 factor (ECF subfamily)
MTSSPFTAAAECGQSPATRQFEDTWSDMELVAAGQHGDPFAFEELCRRYRDTILRAASRVTGNREDAEDAVQDSLLRAFLKLKSFNGRSSFATWLTRIAINSSLMILRKRRSSREILMLTGDDLREWPHWEIEDHRPDPEESLARREHDAILRQAIRSLPSALRIVMEKLHLRDLSTRASAETLGLSVPSVKARSLRGKIALRRYLTVRRFVRANGSFRRTAFHHVSATKKKDLGSQSSRVS